MAKGTRGTTIENTFTKNFNTTTNSQNSPRVCRNDSHNFSVIRFLKVERFSFTCQRYKSNSTSLPETSSWDSRYWWPETTGEQRVWIYIVCSKNEYKNSKIMTLSYQRLQNAYQLAVLRYFTHSSSWNGIQLIQRSTGLTDLSHSRQWLWAIYQYW